MKSFKQLKKYIIWLLLAIVVLVTLFPFIWLLLSSFKAESNIFNIPPTFLPESLSEAINNYARLFKVTPVGFGRILSNTFVVATSVSLGSLLVGSLAAFAFAKYEFKFKRKLFYVVIATMMIPFQVLVIPLYREMVILGWVDSFMALIVPFLGRAYTVFLMRQFMIQVPKDLLDAARLDGCSEFGIFARIVIPLVKPGLVIAGIFNFIYSMSQFLWPVVVLNSSHKYVLSLFLSNLIAARSKEYGMLFAGTVISVLIISVLFTVIQKNLFSTFEISFDK